jgi:mRNA deadenylase 3'-5' endonuclease subunit Ccr4
LVEGKKKEKKTWDFTMRAVFRAAPVSERYSWGGEPPLTCASPAAIGTYDYVFYSVEKLLPCTLLSMPSLDDFESEDPRQPEMVGPQPPTHPPTHPPNTTRFVESAF